MPAALALLYIVGCVICREAVRSGIQEALLLCTQTLLPSLFPMLAAGALLAKTGLPYPLRWFWQHTVGAVAGTSEAGAAASMLGYTAGYHMGVKTTAALFQKKKLNRASAAVLCCSCVHPGVAFSIFAVGIGMFRSALIGCSFYLSVLLADLIVSRLVKWIEKPKNKKEPAHENASAEAVSTALPSAVEAAIRSMLEICGWVLLFGALRRMLEEIAPRWSAGVTILAEVTNAASYAAGRSDVVLCAFSLGFGGICITLQLLRELAAVGVSPARFLLCRTLAGILSALFEWIALRFIPPVALQTCKTGVQAVNPTAGVPGAAALIFLCVVFILELSATPNCKRRSRLTTFSSDRNQDCFHQ